MNSDTTRASLFNPFSWPHDSPDQQRHSSKNKGVSEAKRSFIVIFPKVAEALSQTVHRIHPLITKLPIITAPIKAKNTAKANSFHICRVSRLTQSPASI
jgi:hypothetical protein